MQTVLEKLSESTASEAASHWAELRTILARADRPERGDVPRLAKLTGEIGIDHRVVDHRHARARQAAETRKVIRVPVVA